VLTGALLVSRTWDAVPAGERLVGWVRPIGDLDWPASNLFAALPTLLQFTAGLLLILGLLTRWAGVAVAILFAFLFIRAEWGEPFRTAWPTLMLVVLGLHFAAAGPGRWAVDGLFGGRGGGSGTKGKGR
jgi:putative oxidoreductase